MLGTRSSMIFIGAVALAPCALSHMIMISPQPFGAPDNSPLSPFGYDYPCKMASVVAGSGPVNEWAVGSFHELSFSGSAVHGGGSCQIAVTTDKNPTKQSTFKVIHSIEGGCPGVEAASAFQFKIPGFLPNGELVMAWTWFNRIGNREMYMNCANVKVVGGASDASGLQKLPNMAIANIKLESGAVCSTKEGFDYTFAEIGQNGDTVDRAGTGPFVELCAGEASGDTGPGNSDDAANRDAGSNAFPGGEDDAADDLLTPQAPLDAYAYPDPHPSGLSSSAVYTLTTMIGSVASIESVSSDAHTLTAQQAQMSALPALTPSPGNDAPGTCSRTGALLCNGETLFGICSNAEVVWQHVADGTKCKNDRIVLES